MTTRILRSWQFVQDAVSLIEMEARRAISVRNEFRIALSGGSTPQPIFAALARRVLHWSRTVVTFSDERCVEPSDTRSNYCTASRVLLDHVPIPAQNILRMKGELDPAEAASEYEALLKGRTGSGKIYQHDLLLLGVGEDGHTASLFHGTRALEATDRLVVENYVPKLKAWRLTFTYPLINAARHVLFLVKDSMEKDKILQQVLSGKSDFPCSRVLPHHGRLTWLLGRA
ncbi:MAG: 6-phosphogluconolactonase [Candidatus Xiphinematobacter sp.]|nr:MAG: 6-phosphogluconolactonase [Candidatus Xiphinematobacter sp.]